MNFEVAYAGGGEWEWYLGDDFFVGFGGEILGGEVCVRLRVEGAVFGFEIRGTVRVECDRCLEECSVGVEWSGVGELGELGEFVVVDDKTVDVGRFVYDSVVLALPLKRVHEVCDASAFEGVNFVSEEEFLRAEVQVMGENPEWAKLKNLKL